MNQNAEKLFRKDPFADFMGMKLIEWDEGFAKTEMTITENMLNFHQAANGGALLSLADYTFAIASNSYGQIAVGINTHMSFVKACEVGDNLTCEATEVDKNHRLAVYRMAIKSESGELIATMEGMVYRKKQQF